MRVFVASAAKTLTDVQPNGEGLIAWEALCALAERGHELTVCARELDLVAEPPFRAFALGRTLPSNGLDPIAHAVKAARLFRRLGGCSAFDVVYWLRPIDPPALLFPTVMLSLLPRKTALVVGPVSLPWPADAVGLGRGVTEHLLPRAAIACRGMTRRRMGDVVVLTSTPDVACILPVNWARRARNLPIGIDERLFAPSPIPQRPRALFLGTLTRYKGVPELLDAFALVHRDVAGAELDLVGDGPEREAVARRIAEADLRGSVHLRSAVPHDETPALLRRTRLLVSASHGEPFGRVLLEAMASSRPIVAVGEGGPRTLVAPGEGGFLVPRGNVGQLASCMTKLLQDDDLCRRMGEFNRGRFEQRYTLRAMCDGLEQAFADAVAHRTATLR